MSILAEPVAKKQEELVEAGLKDGLRHEIVKQEAEDEYLSACGERIDFNNLIVSQVPPSMITCPKCRRRNDADFRAIKKARA